MNIAIIGTGNVGGALAAAWAQKGHQINLGVRDVHNFKGRELLSNINTQVFGILDAVEKSDIILISTPALTAIEVVKSLGNTSGKIIIDAMNIIMGKGPEGYNNTTDALLDNTQTRDIVKCFNTTGFNNMQNPNYGNTSIDMFVAGDSIKGKEIAIQLAKDAGFAECYSVGENTNSKC
jgi:predicted dinucleotide-binding enzyme